MPSLQLLQLTDRGRGLLTSRRRTLAVVSGAVLAGGALAYARSSQSRRRSRPEANRGGAAGALAANGDGLSQNGAGGGLAAAKQKRGGLKSLHFLAAILLKKIGPSGTRYLLGLVLTAVLRTAVGA